ncbi:spore germination protein GerW family protein [Actinotalea sp. M2MS4P-6]|uniref:spore germination protein GerW family protein n=1 Tax=Actinotalea sp. M2MS4P-6 TaxID=2983762 RepID=UPI0021E4D9A4|nr:spore germination protein GerW family protein [Actinotalea sp. M2MS4P-6]MCV2393117.1 spore germination protein GerW family protein [Actinotalea sp. M2MS4P-6]
MNVDELVKGARDALTVGRVFGEPIERGEVTVIPVAKAMGGSGGATGEGSKGDGGGAGGFGLKVKPAGVYVIENGHVRWIPAVEPARLLLAAGLTAAAVLAATGRLARARDARTAQIVRAARLAKKIAAAKARRR